MTNEKIGLRKWLTLIIIGLAGQFAWAIENMYLNSYISYLNATAPMGQEFNYSLMIAITTAASAIIATLTTIFMGALSDKVNKRKIFITAGYIIWGISTASFGLVNVNSAQTLIPISMTAMNAAIMVIVIDCLMTFFGSTSNDAAFNSYVTKNIDNKNRGKVESVLSILPLIAMLIIFVGLNFLTTESMGYRWDLFFYIVGGLVSLVGIISIFLMPKEKKEEKSKDTYLSLLKDGFSIKTIKNNKKLYLILLIYFIYGVAIQIFFPYLMVYIEKTCEIDNSGSSFLTPFAIVMAVALLLGSLLSVIVGFLSDKVNKKIMIIPIVLVEIIGLIMMFFIPNIEGDTNRIIYAAISGTIMILGYVGIPTILNSLVRSYIPKGKEGSFMGVRMLFVVLLPMCIGPFIGDALNQNYNQYYINEWGVKSTLPNPLGYIIASIVLLLIIIPFIFLIKKNKNYKDGYLLKDLHDFKDEELHFSLNEHPRPSFRRENYLVLNGEWDYTISEDKSFPDSYEGKIIVPFAVESPMSKVNRLLKPNEYLFYQKEVTLPENLQNKKHLFLVFEGVDQIADVMIDDHLVTSHTGGYTRFKCDIAEIIKDKTTFTIKVRIQDLTDSSHYMRGKQVLKPNMCFYTRSSGIYKPVYLEGVDEDYIQDFKMTSDYDNEGLKIIVITKNDDYFLFNIANKTYKLKTNVINSVRLPSFRPWSNLDPYLYNITLIYKTDIVHTYFGIRKIETKDGHIYLNNKKIILNGLLDQGYYYPGNLTPTSYQQYEKDILKVRSLGYNCLRKHVKVECEYFYYLCDIYGILVIQDLPNGGRKIPFINVAYPRLSLCLNNEKFLSYKKYGRENKTEREQFIKESDEIISSMEAFPSIIMITIFNEAWGEFDPALLYERYRNKYPTFLYDTASGWLDSKKSDVYSLHSYTLPKRKRKSKDNRPYILSETGGIGLKIEESFLYPKLFGHQVCYSQEKLNKKYASLYKALIKQIKEGTLNGIIYTQLADVETEANGIYTFDRQVLKLNSQLIKDINKEINNL